MNSRIDDKIKEIHKFLGELLTIIPSNLEDYSNNLEKKAACERYAEKIIEAIVDLAFLIIKEKRFIIPENDLQVFDILVKENIIEEDLSERLKEAKGMRNILAHEYGEIYDEIVFTALTEELISDAENLIKQIKEKI